MREKEFDKDAFFLPLRGVCYANTGEKTKVEKDWQLVLKTLPAVKENIEQERLLLDGKVIIRFPYKPNTMPDTPK